jgi:diguanylate cyclase (GGDEF)-like protein
LSHSPYSAGARGLGSLSAMDSSNLTQRLEASSPATDALTGAYNVRYLIKNLPSELARSQRYGLPLALLSCDIDRFRQINDAFGHEAGNDLLQAFVARTESCIRKSSDWSARVGGDEFLIVLPGTDVAGAERVAEKLRKLFARAPVATYAGAIHFTASIGVSAIEPRHEIKRAANVDDLLRAADRGLHASKKLGGNHATASGVIGSKPKREKQERRQQWAQVSDCISFLSARLAPAAAALRRHAIRLQASVNAMQRYANRSPTRTYTVWPPDMPGADTCIRSDGRGLR